MNSRNLPAGAMVGAPAPASAEGGARLAASDRRLREEPRYLPLRQALAEEGVVESPQLAALLGLPPLAEGVGPGRLFVEAGLISNEELQGAKEIKRRQPELSLWEALRRGGSLGDEALAMGLAVLGGTPYAALAPDRVEPEALRHLEGRTAARWRALPLRLEGETLLLAAADPKGLDLEEAALLAGRPVRAAAASASRVEAAIARLYGGEGIADAPIPIQELDLRASLPFHQGEEIPTTLSPTVIFNRLLATAVALRASDLHLRPGERFFQVHFRIDGKLHPWFDLPLSLRSHLTSRIKVVTGMDIAEKRLPQDGECRARLSDRLLDIRASVIPAVRGESAVLRLLDHQQGLVKLEDLGFFPEDRERLRRAVSAPHGLVLVTGPTGSGKSTTLRAALSHVHSRENRHILTVEDPVEVRLDGVTQVQVHPRIGYTFAKALRHFLRHDPDVILVGEIRDGETAAIAVQAALTGHMVLSTLHTNDAAGAATRLLDMGVEPYLLASALDLIIAQRLARLLCPRCKTFSPPSTAEEALLRAMGESPPHPDLPRPGGCDACNHTGYRGRTVIYEMLALDEGLRALASRRESAVQLRRAAREGGMLPLAACGLRKIRQGLISLEEAAAYLDTMDGLV
ncbi:MAG: type II/IV secretion system protein [Magnetococcales bacterium]|nr:type II/IV secretion system protein [Magnetococcales bacterium]